MTDNSENYGHDRVTSNSNSNNNNNDDDEHGISSSAKEDDAVPAMPLNTLSDLITNQALTYEQLAVVAMSRNANILRTQADLVDLRSNFSSILSHVGRNTSTGHGDVEYPDLLTLVQSYDWDGSLLRVASHPEEASRVGVEGRTALHLACDHDAPALVVQCILAANPLAALEVGTSNMNPLHITCSSQHASVHVVRVLLEGSDKAQITTMQDVDGDTCLHTACRCGAPIEVLDLLLRANPSVVNDRDFEGLTPLLRLWVRYFVTLGDDVINSVTGPADLVGDLREAWEKTTLLFRAAYHGNLNNSLEEFRILFAAAGVDCPRFVVKLATILHPEQLSQRNQAGETPLVVASKAPIYKEHDLSDEGYYIEDLIHGDLDDNVHSSLEQKTEPDAQHPSVVEILLDANMSVAQIKDTSGRLPLNIAICSEKSWNQGVKKLMTAHPDALMVQDSITGLYPFMLAALAVENDKKKVESNSYNSNEETKLLTIYELLRSKPEVIRWCLKLDDEDNIPSNTSSTQSTKSSEKSQLEAKSSIVQEK